MKHSHETSPRSDRSRSSAVPLALSLALFSAEAGGARAQEPKDIVVDRPGERLVVTAKAMSLAELLQGARQAFVGVVEDVAEKKEKVGKREVEIVTVHIRFRIERVLKGDYKPKEQRTIKQVSRFSSPVHKGEKVLWFLPQESSVGFAAPLAFGSGHFRIEPDPSAPGSERAVNLVENAGLWKDGRIWGKDSPITEEKLSAELKAMGLSSARVRQVMKSAGSAPERNALPLELFQAVGAILEREGYKKD